jgi:hypothetical protein
MLCSSLCKSTSPTYLLLGRSCNGLANSAVTHLPVLLPEQKCVCNPATHIAAVQAVSCKPAMLMLQVQQCGCTAHFVMSLASCLTVISTAGLDVHSKSLQ